MLRSITLGLAVAAAAGTSLAAAGAPAVEPTVVARIRTGSQPCAAAQIGNRVWVTQFGSHTLRTVNPRTNRAVGKAVPVGASPCGIVAGAGSLWVEAYNSNRIDRVNPKRRKVVKRIRVGIQPFDVLFAAGAVWSSDNGSDRVSRIDPRRSRVVRRIRTPGGPAGLAYSNGSIWVGTAGPAATHIYRIDPATNVATRIEVGQAVAGVVRRRREHSLGRQRRQQHRLPGRPGDELRIGDRRDGSAAGRRRHRARRVRLDSEHDGQHRVADRSGSKRCRGHVFCWLPAVRPQRCLRGRVVTVVRGS